MRWLVKVTQIVEGTLVVEAPSAAAAERIADHYGEGGWDGLISDWPVEREDVVVLGPAGPNDGEPYCNHDPAAVDEDGVCECGAIVKEDQS
jgi:hypothetical protein